MTPTALSIISTSLTDGSERNKALGFWGAQGGTGATTAWLIGGPLVDGPGWRWIFFINVPIGLAALALSPVCCARAGPRAVDEAPGADWSDVRTILPLADSAVLVAAFALIEWRHPAPLVQLRILRSRTLAGAASARSCSRSGPRPARSPARPRSARPASARPPRPA